MSLCVIPARSGSKRIPNKNILNFYGKPIIAWSIETALASECFSNVIVSTDSPKIASIAASYGAEVPFIRPKNISDDNSTTEEVILHAIEWFSSRNHRFKHICCLYATAPLIRINDLIHAQQLLTLEKSTMVFPAVKFSFPPQRAIRINSNGQSSAIYPQFEHFRSQDLEEYYHDAGQFYFGTFKRWAQATSLYNDSTPLLIPPLHVQDIDTLEDWRKAEFLFHYIHSSQPC